MTLVKLLECVSLQSLFIQDHYHFTHFSKASTVSPCIYVCT